MPAQLTSGVHDVVRVHEVHEVRDTLEEPLSPRDVHRRRGIARASQVIDYVFFLIYALLTIRFLLALIAARSTAGFVQFIVTVTQPFYAPFKNIVDSPRTDQGHTLLVPVLVALSAYVVLHLAINRLLHLIAVRRTDV
jgi:hypothetical protein